MNRDAQELKADARRFFLTEVRKLSQADRLRHSADICARLPPQSAWTQAESVLLFSPTADEPWITPLLTEALNTGKIVTLPRHIAETGEYAACQIRHAEEGLAPGRFGISEPAGDSPIFPLNELDFVLVPGVGFTLDGGRLGRGRGYFDRLLAAVSGFKCGVAFDCQVAPQLPLEPHDIRLDCILTPTRWHPTTTRARS
ncbi:MAG: 5-formyltetrahydrofolate cyclo-ligase [Verrucomicrobiota bacterium]|jgi:5-formyltetrahydrofolate cyclo-ligase